MQKADSLSHSHQCCPTSPFRSSAPRLACCDLPNLLISVLQHHHPREVREEKSSFQRDGEGINYTSASSCETGRHGVTASCDSQETLRVLGSFSACLPRPQG